MDISIKDVTSNYRERIQRLSLFDPLYKLQNKKGKDKSGKPIDYFGLGLTALLFFFENMLVRNKKTGAKELAEFYQKLNEEEMDLDYDDFEKAARTVIETFRPPAGKRNRREFYNFETRKKEYVEYSILKAERADTQNNAQYYSLDDDGLELIFSTKEYFSEFQISINQLVLRKQLEKGEFASALRQIDEMDLSVKNLEEKMTKIKHEIQRNIISDKTYKRYKDIVYDIERRLKRENDEFKELRSFVKETREKIGNEISNEKDKKAYDLVIKIDRELGEVHHEHTKLFEESIILKTSALQAAQESLYYVGIDSFNFNEEVVSRLLASPLPLNASRRLIEPFLYMEKIQMWSPLTVFSKQRIENEEKKDNSFDFLAVSKKEENDKNIMNQKKNFKTITEIMINAAKGKSKIEIKELVKYMKENGYDNILNNRSFYDYFIILHQKSPVKINYIEKNKDILFEESFDIMSNIGSMLYVDETNELLNVTKRFTLQNMVLRMEEK